MRTNLKWTDKEVYKLIKYSKIYSNDFGMYLQGFKKRTISSIKTKYHHLQKQGLIQQQPINILQKQGNGKTVRIVITNNLKTEENEHFKNQINTFFNALLFDSIPQTSQVLSTSTSTSLIDLGNFSCSM